MNRVLALAVVAAAIVIAAPATASDEPAKRGCSTINLGGPKVFTKHNMRCARAKHHARRLYKTGGRDKPRNFSCSSGSNFRDGGFCEHKSKDKYFGWHPAD